MARYGIRKANGEVVYFDDAVTPREVALAQIDREESGRVRGTSPLDAAADARDALVSGAYGLAEGVGGLATQLGLDGPGNAVQRWARDRRAESEQEISPEALQARADVAPEIGQMVESASRMAMPAPLQYFMDASQNAIAGEELPPFRPPGLDAINLLGSAVSAAQTPESIPRGLVDALAQSAPSMLPSLVGGGAARLALGPSLGAVRAGQVAGGVSAASEGLVSGGMSAAQIDESVRDFAAFDPDGFIESDIGQEALAEADGDYSQAVEIATRRARGLIPYITGASVVAISRFAGTNPFASSQSRAMAGRALLSPIRHGVISEGREEVGQSAVEQLGSNVSMAHVNEDQDLTEGVRDAAVMGGLGGGLMGGAMGAARHLAGRRAPGAPGAPATASPSPGGGWPGGTESWAQNPPNAASGPADPDAPVITDPPAAGPPQITDQTQQQPPVSPIDADDEAVADEIVSFGRSRGFAQFLPATDVDPSDVVPVGARNARVVPLYQSTSTDDVAAHLGDKLKGVYDAFGGEGRDPSESAAFNTVQELENGLYPSPRNEGDTPDAWGVAVEVGPSDSPRTEYIAFDPKIAGDRSRALLIAKQLGKVIEGFNVIEDGEQTPTPAPVAPALADPAPVAAEPPAAPVEDVDVEKASRGANDRVQSEDTQAVFEAEQNQKNAAAYEVRKTAQALQQIKSGFVGKGNVAKFLASIGRKGQGLKKWVEEVGADEALRAFTAYQNGDVVAPQPAQNDSVVTAPVEEQATPPVTRRLGEPKGTRATGEEIDFAGNLADSIDKNNGSYDDVDRLEAEALAKIDEYAERVGDLTVRADAEMRKIIRETANIIRDDIRANDPEANEWNDDPEDDLAAPGEEVEIPPTRLAITDQSASTKEAARAARQEDKKRANRLHDARHGKPSEEKRTQPTGKHQRTQPIIRSPDGREIPLTEQLNPKKEKPKDEAAAKQETAKPLDPRVGEELNRLYNLEDDAYNEAIASTSLTREEVDAFLEANPKTRFSPVIKDVRSGKKSAAKLAEESKKAAATAQEERAKRVAQKIAREAPKIAKGQPNPGALNRAVADVVTTWAGSSLPLTAEEAADLQRVALNAWLEDHAPPVTQTPAGKIVRAKKPANKLIEAVEARKDNAAKANEVEEIEGELDQAIHAKNEIVRKLRRAQLVQSMEIKASVAEAEGNKALLEEINAKLALAKETPGYVPSSSIESLSKQLDKAESLRVRLEERTLAAEASGTAPRGRKKNNVEADPKARRAKYIADLEKKLAEATTEDEKRAIESSLRSARRAAPALSGRPVIDKEDLALSDTQRNLALLNMNHYAPRFAKWSNSLDGALALMEEAINVWSEYGIDLSPTQEAAFRQMIYQQWQKYSAPMPSAKLFDWTDEQLAAVEKSLQATLKGAGLKANVVITRDTIEVGDQDSYGAYYDLHRLIVLSVAQIDPSTPRREVMARIGALMTEEMTHAARHLGAVSKEQWAALQAGVREVLFTDADAKLLRVSGVRTGGLKPGYRPITYYEAFRELYAKAYADRDDLSDQELNDIFEEEAIAKMLQVASFRIAAEDGSVRGLLRSVLNAIARMVKAFVDWALDMPSDMREPYMREAKRFVNSLRRGDYATPDVLAQALNSGEEVSRIDRDSVRKAYASRFGDERGPMAMFAGEKALGLSAEERDSLERAKTMEAEGKDRRTIWQATRWAQTRNGRWAKRLDVRDIDFTPALHGWFANTLEKPGSLTRSGAGKSVFKLEQLIASERLFRAYPQLRKLNVKLAFNSPEGTYSVTGQRTLGVLYSSDHIAVSFDVAGSLAADRNYEDMIRDQLKLFVHELNHIVAIIEGYERGSSAEEMQRYVKAGTDTEFGKIDRKYELLATEYVVGQTPPEHFERARSQFKDVIRATALYFAVEGEAASRESEAAIDYTDEQMAEMPDFITRDTISADRQPRHLPVEVFGDIPLKIYGEALDTAGDQPLLLTAEMIVDGLIAKAIGSRAVFDVNSSYGGAEKFKVVRNPRRSDILKMLAEVRREWKIGPAELRWIRDIDGSILIGRADVLLHDDLAVVAKGGSYSFDNNNRGLITQRDDGQIVFRDENTSDDSFAPIDGLVVARSIRPEDLVRLADIVHREKMADVDENGFYSAVERAWDWVKQNQVPKMGKPKSLASESGPEATMEEWRNRIATAKVESRPTREEMTYVLSEDRIQRVLGFKYVEGVRVGVESIDKIIQANKLKLRRVSDSAPAGQRTIPRDTSRWTAAVEGDRIVVRSEEGSLIDDGYDPANDTVESALADARQYDKQHGGYGARKMRKPGVVRGDIGVGSRRLVNAPGKIASEDDFLIPPHVPGGSFALSHSHIKADPVTGRSLTGVYVNILRDQVEGQIVGSEEVLDLEFAGQIQSDQVQQLQGDGGDLGEVARGGPHPAMPLASTEQFVRVGLGSTLYQAAINGRDGVAIPAGETNTLIQGNDSAQSFYDTTVRNIAKKLAARYGLEFHEGTVTHYGPSGDAKLSDKTKRLVASLRASSEAFNEYMETYWDADIDSIDASDFAVRMRRMYNSGVHNTGKIAASAEVDATVSDEAQQAPVMILKFTPASREKVATGGFPLFALSGGRTKGVYNPPSKKFGAAQNSSTYNVIPEQPGYLDDVQDLQQQLASVPTKVVAGLTVQDKSSSTPFVGGVIDNIDKTVEATLRAGYSKAWRAIGSMLPSVTNFLEGYFPFGGVPDRVALEAYRAMAQGRVGEASDLAGRVSTAVAKSLRITVPQALKAMGGNYQGLQNDMADKVEAARQFMTARTKTDLNAAAAKINDQKLVDALTEARLAILDVGKALVSHHVIHSKQFMSKAGADANNLDSVWGGYLMRVYAETFEQHRHTSGLRASGANYRRFRNENRPAGDRLLKGEVTDVPTLIYLSIEEPLRDLAIYNFFNSIMHHSANSQNGWFLPGSTVRFGGKDRTLWYIANQKERNDQSLREKKDQLAAQGGAKAAGVAAQRLRNEIAILETQSMDMEQYLKANPAYARPLAQGELPKGYAQIPTDPARFGDAAGGIVMKRIYDDIMGGNKSIALDANDPTELAKNIYLGINRFTKFAYTVGNPPTHLRNLYSNTLMLMRSGANAARVLQAVNELVEFNRKKNPIRSRAVDAAIRYGSMKQSFTEAELRAMDKFTQSLQREIEKAKLNSWADKNLGILSPMFRYANEAGAVLAALRDFAAEGASTLYQLGDTIFKVAKIADELDRGTPPVLAALEARKYFFDYSAVHPAVRTARTWALAPFISYIYFAAPVTIDTAFTAPWRLGVQYWMAFSLIGAAAAMMGFSPEEAKMGLNEELEKRAGIIPLQWRDALDRLQFVDLGYITPEGSLMQAALSVPEGDVMGAMQSIGFTGGPVLAWSTVAATGIDPFRGTPVWEETDDDWTRTLKTVSFVARSFLPSTANYYAPPIPAFNETLGGPGWEALAGTGLDRYGEDTVTGAQMAMRMGGLNVYPLDYNHGRRKRLMNYQRLITDLERDLRRAYTDQRLTDAVRANRIEYLNSRMTTLLGEMTQYVAETEYAASLEGERASARGQ